uniref:Uncharacterized protein n=1 Tax=Arundo donax TaxID=35708 RepID=A0A0A9A110_ARUDO
MLRQYRLCSDYVEINIGGVIMLPVNKIIICTTTYCILL